MKQTKDAKRLNPELDNNSTNSKKTKSTSRKKAAQKRILLAEDDPDDAEIFRIRIVRATLPHELHTVNDGQQVIDWLTGEDEYSDRTKFPLPTHLILDLKLPLKNGFELLEWIRQRPQFEELPIIILSSSDERMDVKRAYELGVTTYFVKSPQLQDVMHYLRLSS